MVALPHFNCPVRVFLFAVAQIELYVTSHFPVFRDNVLNYELYKGFAAARLGGPPLRIGLMLSLIHI